MGSNSVTGAAMAAVAVAVVLVACGAGGAMGQSTAGCTSALTSLAPCLNYITGNSTTPSTSCCSQLGSVVQASPQCLCSILNGNVPSFGITINQTLALSLPGACKVQTPSINQCKTAAAPTASATPPAAPPADSSDQTPEAITPSASELPSPSAGGSKTVPSTTTTTTGTGTSHGNSVKTPLLLILFFCFMATRF